MHNACSKSKSEHLQHKIDDEFDVIVEAASELGLRKDDLIAKLIDHWRAHESGESQSRFEESKRLFHLGAGP